MYLRYLPEFEYLTPQNVKDVCSLLLQHAGKAKVMAGGTDLLVLMKNRSVTPQYVVALGNVPYIDGISFSEAKGLRLGTLATHQSIADSPVIKNRFGCLAEACSKVGTPQIRNMGTIGGNLCNGAPSADSAPPLIAFGALIKLINSGGERIIPLEDFFIGPGETAFATGEILTEIQVPCPPSHTGGVYLKLPARTAVDIAAVGVAALITLGLKNEICSDIRIVLGAVAPTPIRAKMAEEIIKGKRIDDVLIKQAAQLASEEALPISDVRSSAEYRLEMVKVLTRTAINQAIEKAKLA